MAPRTKPKIRMITITTSTKFIKANIIILAKEVAYLCTYGKR